MATGFLTFLPHLSRLDAPTPQSSHSKEELPEDFPVVRNMLHRLAGKGGSGGRSRSAPVSQRSPSPLDCVCVLGTL